MVVQKIKINKKQDEKKDLIYKAFFLLYRLFCDKKKRKKSFSTVDFIWQRNRYYDFTMKFIFNLQAVKRFIETLSCGAIIF